MATNINYQESFIARAKQKHGEKYDYSKVIYKNSQTKVRIVCPEHGEFEQTPVNHVRWGGCPECAKIARISSFSLSTTEFIQAAVGIHGNKYNYDKTEYTHHKGLVVITCRTHGDFTQTPDRHLYGKSGCPTCAKEQLISVITDRNSKAQNNAQNRFFKECKEVHGNKYDYSQVVYSGTNHKVVIICPTHGEFKQIPRRHLAGDGCPRCRESKGEHKVSCWLELHGIRYERHVAIKEFNPRKKFDFFLPDHAVYLEYDGIQHYKPMGAWAKRAEQQLKRDSQRNAWCTENGVNLIVIPYYEDVDQLLSSKLLQKSCLPASVS